MELSMKALLSLTIMIIAYSEASPISKKSVEETDPLLQSIHVRLDVLNKTVSSMIYSSKIAKYESVCRIIKSAKRVLDTNMDELSSQGLSAGFIVAGQQIQDICDWMATNTYSSNIVVNCSSVYTSFKSVSNLCNEVSLTSNISGEIGQALEAVEGIVMNPVVTAEEQLQFTNEFTQNLPEKVHTIICESVGCQATSTQ